MRWPSTSRAHHLPGPGRAPVAAAGAPAKSSAARPTSDRRRSANVCASLMNKNSTWYAAAFGGMPLHGSAESHGQRSLLPLTLTAVGVVYGDIGTSPLYAMRECFFGSHSVPPTHDNVLGVLSLIIYSLLIVISVKYMVLVLRADNNGEGGILALTSLIPPRGGPVRPILVLLGIFGAALLYGDGM